MSEYKELFNIDIRQTDVDQNLAYHYTMRDSVAAVLMSLDCQLGCLDSVFAS